MLKSALLLCRQTGLAKDVAITDYLTPPGGGGAFQHAVRGEAELRSEMKNYQQKFKIQQDPGLDETVNESTSIAVPLDDEEGMKKLIENEIKLFNLKIDKADHSRMGHGLRATERIAKEVKIPVAVNWCL